MDNSVIIYYGIGEETLEEVIQTYKYDKANDVYHVEATREDRLEMFSEEVKKEIVSLKNRT
ncbi:hypothetical protein HCJ47_13610 [Listeria sp. FSL L7-1558]|nr:hypothetical protein [Listeria immobilis]MBC1484429.1 hypothetical protein [Listeria immobilis]